MFERLRVKQGVCQSEIGKYILASDSSLENPFKPSKHFEVALAENCSQVVNAIAARFSATY